MSLKRIFIRVQRTIGTIQLDAVLDESHANSVTITKNPVEAGADITDHAIVQPKKVNIRGVVSDTPLGTAAFGQLVDAVTRLFGTSTESNLTRTQQAYGAMVALMERREPIEVTTGLVVYPNMYITTITTSQDKDTANIVVLNISCEEIVFTESAVAFIPEEVLAQDVKKSGSSTVDKGKEEQIPVGEDRNRTILKTLADWVRG